MRAAGDTRERSARLSCGSLEWTADGFGLRFREGAPGALELLEVRPGEWIYRLGRECGGTMRWYRVGHTCVCEDGVCDRRLWIEREPGGGAAADGLAGATLFVGSRTAGTVSVPMARWRPDTTSAEASRRPREFASAIEPCQEAYDVCLSALDGLPGTVCVTGGAAATSVTPFPDRCAALTRVYGDAGDPGGLVIEHEFQKELWLRDGERHELARQIIIGPSAAGGNWQAGVAAVGGRFTREGLLPPADRPAWAQTAVVYEVDLVFHGGLAKFTSRLDAIQRLGFNTIYLMPWHRGGYGTTDYLQLNPALGTFAELRALCDAAHARGMKVLFDLLLVVAADGSPYLTEHPDWFYRDAAGAILPHRDWQNHCLDPAAPGLRRFLTDYAARCCREWGADGFRVDSTAHRGGCWHSAPGRQPHEHSDAVFTLLREIRAAIRSVNPEAILLAECFGPLQTPYADLVGFQWITWLDWLMARLNDGRVTGAELERILGQHFLTMPRDTWLTTYTHTHDTLVFSKRDPAGPAVDALFTTLALLSAGTMVFGGGWGMPTRPTPAQAGEYQELFAFKRALGGLASHEVGFPRTVTDRPELFIADRPSRAGRVRLITNFSAHAQPLDGKARRLYTRCGSAGQWLAPYDSVVVGVGAAEEAK